MKPTDKAKMYLNWAFYYKNKAEVLADKIEVLRSRAEKITASYQDAPVFGSFEDHRQATMSEMVDLEREYEKARTLCRNKRKEVEFVINLLENYQEMADNAQLAIDKAPDNVQAYYLKGKAMQGLAQEDEAVNLFTKAIDLQNDFAEALLLRGQIYLRQAKLTEALADAEAVIASGKEVESGLLLRGSVKEVENQPEDAEADYRQVLELDPFNQQAYIYIGKLYLKKGRYADAIGVMDDAIEMSPVFAQAYEVRAEAKRLAGDDEGAAKDATAAANLKAASEVTSEVVDPAASIKEIDILHL